MTENLHAQVRTFLILTACMLGTLMSALPSAAYAAENDICALRGYTVGFFNGVWNTLPQAISGRMALQTLIGDKHNGEPVEYENFYNTTGSSNDATMAQDIAEVFIQRANEFDHSGELGKRFEYLWEAASDPEKPLLLQLWGISGAQRHLLEGFYTAIASRVVAGWSSLLSTPPTTLNYAQHRLTIDTLATEGQKMLFIAHSQGNLFVNPAFDYAKTKFSTTSVATVHIAPASMTLRGPYLLADIDAVINGLRSFGSHGVPANNLMLPISSRDLSGHRLIETYLDESRAGRARVNALANTGLASLVTPHAIANRGFFTSMLTWNGTGDVDLHTVEPGGAHVYYVHRQGQAGSLDVDNVIANGPEHYYASCDPARLQEGTYRIGINHFANATGRTATVQISFAQGGQPLTKSLDVGPERGFRGQDNPLPVMTVTVTKDHNGKYQATAQ